MTNETPWTALAIALAAVLLAAVAVFYMMNKPKWDCRAAGNTWSDIHNKCLDF